jgi:hypothetical protein
VHDPVGFVEIYQSGEDGFCNLAQHVDANGSEFFRDAVKRSV